MENQSTLPEQHPREPEDYTARPPKDKSIALILELLPGFFGFLGFGWIYSGNTNTGVLLLAGMIVWSIIAVGLVVLTGGLACFCTLPINLAVVGGSAYFLNQYTKEHPELFGA